MSNEGRSSVYWPIMVAAGIGALGTVAAAVVGKVDVGAIVAPREPAAKSPAPPRPPRATPGEAAPLPPDWIDARGRYYSVRQSGGTLGVIAYDGGQRALEKDKVRLTGDGTIAGGRAAWSWAGDNGRNAETCAGRATPSAVTVRCARGNGDTYDLRLVVRS